MYILDQQIFDPKSVCETLNYCQKEFEPLSIQPILRVNHRHDTQREYTRRSSGQPIRILQLADIHIDPDYAEGSAVNCGMYTCCRKGYPGNGSAGPYGEYNCDLPGKTFKVLVEEIRKITPKPDFIIYTGDAPPHDVWSESWASQLSDDEHVIDELANLLPNTTIYPALGNHESFPANLYYMGKSEYQVLNNRTVVWWKKLFEMSEEQEETIRTSAYYTTLIRPGLRILSFNSDYGYNFNFYIILNDQIPQFQQMKTFMINTLESARKAGEKVIIIGHIAPGDLDSTVNWYGDFYVDLVANYSDTIVLQTFAHTHHDEFKVVTSPTNEAEHLGVLFLAPSMTPRTNVNPSFRVFSLDSQTFELLDFDQYSINLTEANERGNITARKTYSAKSEYGLHDMSPRSWYKLTERFLQRPSVLDRYRYNELAGSGKQGDCDTICKLTQICKVLNNRTVVWWKKLFEMSEEQEETIRTSAYYTTLIRPGLRILSFNSDYGYNFNFYIILNDQIPQFQQMKTFMINTLESARKAGEKVIIIGHIAPGDLDSTVNWYGDFYVDLVANYSDTIVLQTFAHTHHDEFKVVTSPTNEAEHLGVLFLAPSMTPRTNVNPSFRVFSLDSQTFELLDFDQYSINLTEANERGNITARKTYSAKSEYGLHDMSPRSWYKLTERFLQRPSVLDRY
ncbi:hypothetical protein ScPMuIL_018177 [Solemya velum]